MINQIRQNESQKWLTLFSKATSIGINNVAVLNTISGELTGKSNTFILDDSLLDQIKFLDKYSLKEDGSPAVRIIGNIPEIGRIITKTKTLYEEDLLNAYITNKLLGEAQDYIKFICHSNTTFLPFYFLLRRMNLKKDEAVEYLESLKIKHFVAESLVKRIQSEEELKKRICYKFANTPLGKKRKEFFTLLLDNKSITFIEGEKDVKIFLEALSKFDRTNLPIENIRPYLKLILKEYYPFRSSKTINYLFRNILTFIDYLEHGYE